MCRKGLNQPDTAWMKGWTGGLIHPVKWIRRMIPHIEKKNVRLKKKKQKNIYRQNETTEHKQLSTEDI